MINAYKEKQEVHCFCFSTGHSKRAKAGIGGRMVQTRMLPLELFAVLWCFWQLEQQKCLICLLCFGVFGSGETGLALLLAVLAWIWQWDAARGSPRNRRCGLRFVSLGRPFDRHIIRQLDKTPLLFVKSAETPPITSRKQSRRPNIEDGK